MAKLCMAHASTHGARKPPGQIFLDFFSYGDTNGHFLSSILLQPAIGSADIENSMEPVSYTHLTLPTILRV